MSISWRAFICAAAFALAGTGAAAAADMAEVRRALADQRYFDAYDDLRELAEAGHPEAQFELAGFHHYGRIGAASFEKALGWYSRSASQGNIDAMVGLAAMFGHGQGVARDPETSYRWLATARRMGPSPDVDRALASAMEALRPELDPAQVAAAEAQASAFVPTPE